MNFDFQDIAFKDIDVGNGCHQHLNRVTNIAFRILRLLHSKYDMSSIIGFFDG